MGSEWRCRCRYGPDAEVLNSRSLCDTLADSRLIRPVHKPKQHIRLTFLQTHELLVQSDRFSLFTTLKNSFRTFQQVRTGLLIHTRQRCIPRQLSVSYEQDEDQITGNQCTESNVFGMYQQLFIHGKKPRLRCYSLPILVALEIPQIMSPHRPQSLQPIA